MMLAGLLLSCALAAQDDWPQWRHDAQRSGATAHDLPEKLHLQWVRELPPLKPAWPDQPRMQFDAAYEPVVLGRTMFVGSSRSDSLTALDTRTGEEKWMYLADGPVRFAPVAWEGRVYFASDDGHLYCLDAEKGTLHWKFRGGPNDRRILGNERLISTWPARGAPVIADETVYFAAGIWPFMGIFIHALDARTGRAIWTQDGDGSLYIKQPHNADAFAGVAPQGHLVVAGDKLLIPGGRSVAACYDRRTGKLIHYALGENNRRGGYDVTAAATVYFAGGAALDLATGLGLEDLGRPLVVAGDAVYSPGKSKDITVTQIVQPTYSESKDSKGKMVMRAKWKPPSEEKISAPRPESMIKAGRRLYLGCAKKISALEKGKVSWEADIEGTPLVLLAADDRLFAVTREGRIYCFGAERVEPVTHAWTPVEAPTGVLEGWCVAWSVGRVAELARQSKLRIIAVDPDARKVDAARRELIAAGLYGERVAVHVGDPHTFSLPPYLASLMLCEDLDEASAAKAFESLRPYGGVASLPGGRLHTRAGGLPGAANWTHEHADAANTRVSKDSVVRAPLGLLWFGGPSHDGILPRHGHGPQPQVIDGRLIIEGVDMVRALDIYTGRLLWETKLPAVGKFYNNTSHQPGANASGGNIVSMADGIYVAWGKSCVRLDPATGKVLSTFSQPSTWGYINVFEDYLVSGADPLGVPIPVPAGTGDDDPDEPDMLLKKLLSLKSDNDAFSSSRRLVVMNRHTGETIWTALAEHGFRHNTICIGGGRVYCVDRLSGPQLDRMKKRGEKAKSKPRLLAFDLATGREVWRSDVNIFGTWLSFAADVLVEAGRVARDTVRDEPKGMRAWRASDGAVLWDRKEYNGPAMIRGDKILMADKACDLRTGALWARLDPITGQPVAWTWTRNYGCNTPAASEHLMTFRSGAAGYFDLRGDGGTGNFGGFRSSCTNNLVVAGGVLTAPDYTRTCTCSYQNQSSLALVPMAEAEMWTFFGTTEVKGPVMRAGINLGAPGDRRAEDGTLWLEYPSTAGKSPALNVVVAPANPEWFRRHASRVGGDWVAASGVKGIESLTITLDKDARAERVYTVRLHFVEPDGAAPGERLFSVAIQGREVLRDLDIAKEAGGPSRSLVKEFAGVRAGKELSLTLAPGAGKTVLCGIEVVAVTDMPVHRYALERWEASAGTPVDSPARREIAKRLLAGDAAVWVLVESGAKDADDAAAALLEGRPGFSMIRVPRDERMPVPDGPAPVAVAVYGRGRMLEPLAGERLSEKHIRAQCAHLLSPALFGARPTGAELLLPFDAASFAVAPPVVAPPEPEEPLLMPQPEKKEPGLRYLVWGIGGLTALLVLLASARFGRASA